MKTEIPDDAVLCYVALPWCYFTTQDLDKQTGDGWADVPYEHNADPPYEPCWHNHPDHINRESGRGDIKAGELCRYPCCIDDWDEDGNPMWSIFKVAVDPSYFVDPAYGHCNSPYSVDAINAGAAAWLSPRPYGLAVHNVYIQAGTAFSDFIKLVEKAGSCVYVPHTASAEKQTVLTHSKKTKQTRRRWSK